MLRWGLYLYALADLPWFGVLASTVAAIYLGVAVWYLSREIGRVRRGQASLPKVLLFAIVIPVPWLAFLYVSVRPEVFAIAAIATNIGHSLQYQRLTWFHNRNRYAEAPVEPET